MTFKINNNQRWQWLSKLHLNSDLINPLMTAWKMSDNCLLDSLIYNVHQVLKATLKKNIIWRNTLVGIIRINIFPFSSGSKCMGNCDKIHVAKYTDWIMSLGKFKRGERLYFFDTAMQCCRGAVRGQIEFSYLSQWWFYIKFLKSK